MKTIAIVNTKGGCGKTTTAINLAASLGWKGLPVLLIDMDPQGHATLGVNVSVENEPGLYNVFSEQCSIDEAIIQDVVAGIDLIPATNELVDTDRILSDFRYERILRHELDKIKNIYDFIIIDCAPTLNSLTMAALLASDEVIAPVEMSLFSLDSVEKLFTSIHLLEQQHHIELPVKILPTMVDNRTRLARAFMRSIWERFADDVLPIMVHNTVRIREAVCKGLPIIDYDAESPATYDYKRLAEEVIQTSDPDFMRMDIRKAVRQRQQEQVVTAA